MKKIIAYLTLAIMIAILVVPCCVSAKESCPVCGNGALISVTYSDWKQVYGGAYIHWEKDHWDGPYWKERTVYVRCSKGKHQYTETKDRGVVHGVDVATWGWGRILH